MRTVCDMPLVGANLKVVDQRPQKPGFTAKLHVNGLRISSHGVNPLYAMLNLMTKPEALRWKREMEGRMPDILSAS